MQRLFEIFCLAYGAAGMVIGPLLWFMASRDHGKERPLTKCLLATSAAYVVGGICFMIGYIAGCHVG